jgi:predicted phosphate transport protein (TIGR00153 family)
MRLLPREEKFFTLFNKQVEVISEASRLLLEGVKAGNSRLAEVTKQIMALERQGDEIIHEIFIRLNQTFITPLDPEDIHNLSSKLDDVLDGIEDSAHRMVAYRLERIPPEMVAIAEIIHRCCHTLQKAFHALEKNEKIMEDCIEVNRLENEADNLVRTAVADLFETQKSDPILLIKLKEIYEFLESTTDRCEDVADVLQNVVVKNS